MGQIITRTYRKLIRTYNSTKRVSIANVKGKIKGDPAQLRIIGFLQMYNEAKSGHLRRCLSHLKRICDDIVIYDDASSDESVSIAKEYTSNILISQHNDFTREIFQKQELLDLALSLKPDWIVWLDADELFDREGELDGIRALCQYGTEHNIDGFSFLYYNLWKNERQYRTDEYWLKNWQVKVWKNNGKLQFDLKSGLHNQGYPLNMKNVHRTDIKIIHYGFSSEEKVNKKYSRYESLGQIGRRLERISDERGLTLRDFSIDWFPLSLFRISVVCLIYKSRGYANFVSESFRKHTKDFQGNVEFLFVANDPTDALLDFLQEKNLSHMVYRNKDPNEYYINRVYRAWNYGGSNASGDILVFVNSDMAFSEGWLYNLLKNLRENRIVTSRLVESGKLRSGKFGIEKDFGRTYTDFDDLAFQTFAKKISSSKIEEGGLFMPCAIYKHTFIKSGGYPEGNRKEQNGKITSGDYIYFYETLRGLGIKHYTVFDSIVYHIQEGEMDWQE